MGMIMKKCGKFKDRHPVAFKVFRVVYFVFFALAIFVFGFWAGCVTITAKEYRQGYIAGSFASRDNSFSPAPILDPRLGIPLDGDLSVAPSRSSVEVVSAPDFYSIDDSEYVNFVFSSVPVAASYISSGYFDFDSSYGLPTFGQSAYGAAWGEVPRTSSVFQSLCDKSFLPENVIYTSFASSSGSSNVNLQVGDSVSYNLEITFPHISFKKSDILRVIPSFSSSPATSFLELLRYLSSSDFWQGYLSCFRVSCVTTIPESVTGFRIYPSGALIDSISFPEAFNLGGGCYMPVYVIYLEPIYPTSGTSLSGSYNSFLNYADYVSLQYYERFYDSIYDVVYNIGYKAGYDVGFSSGNTSINIDWLLGFSNSFLSMPIFGGVTLGNFLMVGIMLASFGGLLKLFFGG